MFVDVDSSWVFLNTVSIKFLEMITNNAKKGI